MSTVAWEAGRLDIGLLAREVMWMNEGMKGDPTRCMCDLYERWWEEGGWESVIETELNGSSEDVTRLGTTWTISSCHTHPLE